MSYSPWADAAERYPDVHIERCACSPFRGAWIPEQRVILLDRRMRRPERSAVLAHEIAHIDLEHSPHPVTWFNARAEFAADKLAARRLVDLGDLANAARMHDDHASIAEALEVPVGVLRLRLDHLHPSERAALARALEATE